MFGVFKIRIYLWKSINLCENTCAFFHCACSKTPSSAPHAHESATIVERQSATQRKNGTHITNNKIIIFVNNTTIIAPNSKKEMGALIDFTAITDNLEQDMANYK